MKNNIKLSWYFIEVLFAKFLNLIKYKKNKSVIPIGVYCYEIDHKLNELEPLPNGQKWIKTCKYYRVDKCSKGIACTYVGHYGFDVCLYDRCKNDKVVYVGQAENVHQRLVEHMKTKDFDAVFYLRVPAHKMNKIETALISYLKPEYNKTSLNSGNKDASLAESILNTHGLNFNGA